MPICCKGDADKQRLIKDHVMICILHLRIFGPQHLRCCCKKPLGNDVYLFVRTPKSSKKNDIFSDKNAKAFAVSKDCAVVLADMGGIPLPPRCRIFNKGAIDDLVHPEWDAVNLELYRGIQCLCGLTGLLPGATSQLGRFLAYMVRNPGKRTQDFAVIEFNKSIISLLPHSKSMRAEYASIMGEAELTRFDMRFPSLEAILAAHNHVSNL
jgi:hypothetical protein